MEQLERNALWPSNFRKLGKTGWVASALLLLLGVRVWYWWFVAPQTLNPDEAALLLNARFLVESGMDEWGQAWPFMFRSFGDAKLPGYVYLVSVLAWVTNYAWWSVRLPSVLAGVLIPALAGQLMWQLSRQRWSGWLTAAAIVASPWSWHYGTTGYEANVGLALFLAALVCWFRREGRWQWDVLATIFYAASVMTYNAPLLLFPVLFISGLVWRWPQRTDVVRFVIGSAAVFAIMMWVTLPITLQKSSITLWSDPTVLSEYPAYRQSWSGVWQTVLGNQWVYFAVHIIENWWASWSWPFLVIKGGQNPWHTIPLVGHLHVFLPVIAIWGLPIVAWRAFQRGQWRAVLVLLIWLSGAILPASITVDAPHATRSLFFFVMFGLSAGWAGAWFVEWLQQRHWSYRLTGLATLLGILLFGTLWWMAPAQPRWKTMLSPKWRMGLAQTLQSPQVQAAPRVIILDPDGVLYVYPTVYESISARDFTSSVQRSAPDTVGLVRVESVGRYRFAPGKLSAEELAEFPPGSVWIEQRSNTTWDIIEL